MPKLTDKIKNPTQVLDTGKRKGPLWEGPSGNGPNGGITFSMLSRYLVCKERFRIQYLEGLQVREGFNHRLEFGNMWHLAEEISSVERCTVCNGSGMLGGTSGYTCPGCNWGVALQQYTNTLSQKYPLDRSDIYHWHRMCTTEFPEYLNYWSKQPEQQQSTTLLQEQVFDVPYKLPSGRTVRLRGKWDRVDLLDGKIYLGENKTKSQIDSIKIKRQLTFDLQTMMYLITLKMAANDTQYGGCGQAWVLGVGNQWPIVGVKYNVVRRSAHKSPESMLKKIREDIADGRGGEWFARWTVDITQDDINTFRLQCLDPILEDLCNWWRWMTDVEGLNRPFLRGNGTVCGQHYRFPNGIYNPLTEGGQSEYDQYLATGSMEGLERGETLFRELQS